MPLPRPNAAWPPKELARVTPRLEEWGAWWSGDPGRLHSVYGGSLTTSARPSQRRGGVMGVLARMWWGRPQVDLTQHRDTVHVPLAADIATASADLLFAEPPEIRFGSAATQDWFEEEYEDGLLDVLTGAAERGAALGGVYLRVTWDPSVRDRVFTTAVPADGALPEFQWGVLRAVTFWSEVAVDGAQVWRHIERHELDTAGRGLIAHGLYLGSENSLGNPVPLEARPETAPMAAAVDAEGYVRDGRTPGLCVQYIPNTGRLAAKSWASVPEARYLGASDYDGLESMLDNLDEIHAAWLRDIRLAKARLVVARYMLDDGGPGAGATFNLDQEVFAPLKMAAAEDGDAAITPVQFAIRYEEHRASAAEWERRIIRGAGYSPQTFGEYEGGAQMTATEVTARDNRSLITRGRKIRSWRPALAEHLRKLVAVQAEVFRTSGLVGDELEIVFPKGINESLLQNAQTAQALRAAEAASTRTLVELAHPDWPDDRVEEEVRLILDERGSVVADPFTIGAPDDEPEPPAESPDPDQE